MEKNPYSTIFSHYGGKGKLARFYPEPAHKRLIEPFAGSAAYAWRYHTHDVWINELDPRTFSIWAFLLRPDALDWIREYVPATPQVGQKVSEILPPGETPDGLVELL